MKTEQKRLLAMVLIFTGIVATAACGDNVRRSLNNMIDEQEETAEQMSGILLEHSAEFQAQLRERTEHMTTEWNAGDWEQFNGDVDHDYELALSDGCPFIDYSRERTLSDEEKSRQTAERDRCRCLRNIVNQYRRDVNAFRPERFTTMRDDLAVLTDEELAFAAPLIREQAMQNSTYTPDWAESTINRRREAMLQDPVTTPIRQYCRY